MPAKCTSTAPCLSQPLPATFSPGAAALKQLQWEDLDEPELGSSLSSPQGSTIPSLCFLSTAEVQVHTAVFLIRRDPGFGVRVCWCSPTQTAAQAQRQFAYFMYRLMSGDEGFFPLISVIKAPSCHSYGSNTSNSNLIILRNSHPATFLLSPCLSLLMLSGATLHLGGGTCEGNNRPFAGLARFQGSHRQSGDTR